MTAPATVLLVCQDLFFVGQITGTGQAQGLRIDTAGSLDVARQKLSENNYRAVLLDLTLPGLDVAELMAALPSDDRPRVIAFGPHVQTARFEEATAAGCDEVLPRSRFSATLPDLLRQFAD